MAAAADRLLAFHEARLLDPPRGKNGKGKCKGKGKACDEQRGRRRGGTRSLELHLALFDYDVPAPAEPGPEPACCAATAAAEDDNDDDDDRREDADAAWLFALDWALEGALINAKRRERFVRSTADNRKPKPGRLYVRSRDHKRAEAQKAWMREHFVRRKDNACLANAVLMSMRPYRHVADGAAVQFVDPASAGFTVHPSERHLTRSGQHLHVLPAHIRNAIMALQFKATLTPEDYELLLMLDETVAPKTLSRREVNAYPVLTANDDNCSGDKQCMICLGGYTVGDKMRRLPCMHVFHLECIDAWLLHSSNRCPLDNLNLRPS